MVAKNGRVFLRGMTSEHYGLKEFRAAQLAAPRVRGNSVVMDDAKVGHSGDSDQSRTWWRVGPGDTLYVPQNTIAQHFSADGQPLRLLSGQNRLFKQLGYGRVASLENAPEFDAAAVELARA